MQVYNSIGATPKLELKRKVLEWAVSDIKLQDFFYPIGSVSSSSYEGLSLAWNYYKENFTRIRYIYVIFPLL